MRSSRAALWMPSAARRTLRSSWSVLVVVSALASACTTTTIIQKTGDGTDTTAEGTGQRRASQPCKTGGKTLAIDAFDYNSDASVGKACDVGKLLDDDGSFAALDSPTSATRKIAGHDVGGCVAAEFSEGVTLNSITMKMRPISQGCGHPCDATGDNGCGTGWKLVLFAGPSLSGLDFVQELNLTQKDFFEYRVAVYDTFQARFVAVCQTGPSTGDDTAIDSIYGFCN